MAVIKFLLSVDFITRFLSEPSAALSNQTE